MHRERPFSYTPPMFGIGNNKKNTTEPILPEDVVHLQPLFGIPPSTYLVILFSLILAGILFGILIAPGIAHPGSQLTITSEPAGAALRIDGVYAGTTPCTVFVPRGERTLEFVLPGFTPETIGIPVGSRLVGSLFVPRHGVVHRALHETEPGAALVQGAADYAAWSFAGEPSEKYQIPRSLSEGAYRSGLSSAPGVSPDAILHAAARFAHTRAGVRDLVRAAFLAGNGGQAASPVSALRSLEVMLTYLSEAPGAASWVAGFCSRDSDDTDTAAEDGDRTGFSIAHTPWVTKQAAAAETLAQAPTVFGNLGGTVDAGGLGFRAIPGGSFVFMIHAPDTVREYPRAPVALSIAPLYIAETECTRASWDAFLADTPQWDPAHTPELRDQGLVTAEYLQAVDNPGAAPDAVHGVSWYAAQAYCAWLTAQLAAGAVPGLADYEARLPTEAEWEYGAKALGVGKGPQPGQALPTPLARPVRNMLGGMWEWCAGPFAPLAFLPADPAAINAVGSAERPVRGGCSQNEFTTRPESVTVETRASLPPETCSPFVSFRPVLVRRGEGTTSPARESN